MLNLAIHEVASGELILYPLYIVMPTTQLSRFSVLWCTEDADNDTLINTVRNQPNAQYLSFFSMILKL